MKRSLIIHFNGGSEQYISFGNYSNAINRMDEREFERLVSWLSEADLTFEAKTLEEGTFYLIKSSIQYAELKER